jgi:hypothetical protein
MNKTCNIPAWITTKHVKDVIKTLQELKHCYDSEEGLAKCPLCTTVNDFLERIRCTTNPNIDMTSCAACPYAWFQGEEDVECNYYVYARTNPVAYPELAKKRSAELTVWIDALKTWLLTKENENV